MNMYVVEMRSLQLAQKTELYLSSDYVYFASSLDRAEFWMESHNGQTGASYCFVVVNVGLDDESPFELIGYYDPLGQKTTRDRAIALVTRGHGDR